MLRGSHDGVAAERIEVRHAVDEEGSEQLEVTHLTETTGKRVSSGWLSVYSRVNCVPENVSA